MDDPRLTDVPFEEDSRFVVRVGTEAREYGASSPRVADYVARLARAFGLRGGSLPWPNHLLFVVQDRERRRQPVDIERLATHRGDEDRSPPRTR